MEKKNKIILAVTAAVVVAVIAIVAIVSSNSGKDSSGNISSNTSISQSAQTSSNATEKPIVKPTFMYFVSQQDEQYQAALDVFAKLRQEFADRVEFDLKELEADPSIAENFSLVIGQTPALIMLDIHNDICNFLFSTTDEEQLRDAITKALGE